MITDRQIALFLTTADLDDAHPIEPRHVRVLDYLCHLNAPIQRMAMAESFDFSTSAMKRIVATLIEAKLVSQTIDVHAVGRPSVLSATKKGRALRAALVDFIAEAQGTQAVA
jgi:DNA-binding MarR family transcriptional regulator